MGTDKKNEVMLCDACYIELDRTFIMTLVKHHSGFKCEHCGKKARIGGKFTYEPRKAAAPQISREAKGL